MNIIGLDGRVMRAQTVRVKWGEPLAEALRQVYGVRMDRAEGVSFIQRVDGLGGQGAPDPAFVRDHFKIYQSQAYRRVVSDRPEDVGLGTEVFWYDGQGRARYMRHEDRMPSFDELLVDRPLDIGIRQVRIDHLPHDAVHEQPYDERTVRIRASDLFGGAAPYMDDIPSLGRQDWRSLAQPPSSLSYTFHAPDGARQPLQPPSYGPLPSPALSTAFPASASTPFAPGSTLSTDAMDLTQELLKEFQSRAPRAVRLPSPSSFPSSTVAPGGSDPDAPPSETSGRGERSSAPVPIAPPAEIGSIQTPLSSSASPALSTSSFAALPNSPSTPSLTGAVPLSIAAASIASSRIGVSAPLALGVGAPSPPSHLPSAVAMPAPSAPPSLSASHVPSGHSALHALPPRVASPFRGPRSFAPPLAESAMGLAAPVVRERPHSGLVLADSLLPNDASPSPSSPRSILPSSAFAVPLMVLSATPSLKPARVVAQRRLRVRRKSGPAAPSRSKGRASGAAPASARPKARRAPRASRPRAPPRAAAVPRPIRAVLFDLDGILSDSEDLHRQTFNEVFARFGVSVPKGYWHRHYIGTGSRHIIRDLISRFSLDADPDALLAERKERFLSAIAGGRLKSFPASLSLLRWARHNGLQVAVASGGHRAHVAAQLKALGLDDLPFFGLEDVARLKPDPEVFLKAARFLGAKPPECLVVEDAAAGLRAARAAGMRCVLVGPQHDASLRATADLHLGRMDFAAVRRFIRNQGGRPPWRSRNA